MRSRRKGMAFGRSRTGSRFLKRSALMVLRWIAVPSMAIALFATLAAAGLSLYSTTSSTQVERFASLALPGNGAALASIKQKFIEHAEKLAQKSAADDPNDPFRQVIADAALTREKLLSAFADAGLAVVRQDETITASNAAFSMPSEDRFQQGQVVSGQNFAAVEQEHDPLSSFALTHAGVKAEIAYAPAQVVPGDAATLAMATLALEPVEENIAVASAEQAIEEAGETAARPATRAERRNARQRAQTQDIASAASDRRSSARSRAGQTASAPARRPGISGRLESSPAALAYARPDRPDNGAFNKLFNTPKAGNRVAIYDISAAVVYMPDGTKLEAHSGIGKMADNPRYVHVKNNGPTPPNTYKLSMRESLFYGVEAIRMTPVGNQTMHGRDGILAHSYLLRGGRAESHGCVAFKQYDRFLKAFKDGKVTHMIVVPRMSDAAKVQMVSTGGK